MLFIFGLCIIFLFRSYPYDMGENRLCQRFLAIFLRKKYHIEQTPWLASYRQKTA